MAEPVSIVTTIAIAIVAAERIISEVRSRRALSNGHAPFTKSAADTMKKELLDAIKRHASKVDEHIKENATQHADLHDRVTECATGIAHIEGRLEK